MDNRSYTLPKGDYYFGDLSHVISDREEWGIIADNLEKEIGEYKDQKYIIIAIYGNGYFSNHCGKKESVGVDSGTLGLIPVNVLNKSHLKQILDRGDLGYIYSSNYDLKIDIQGGKGDNYGFHIYPKKETYLTQDAIFIVIDQDEIDESAFIDRCPPFDEDECGEGIILYGDDEDEEENNLLTDIEKNKLEKEINKYTREIESNRLSYRAYYYRGLAKKKLYSYGSDDLEIVLQIIEPLSFNANEQIFRGLSILELDDSFDGKEKAIECFSEALNIDPSRTSAYLHRGRTKEQIEDIKGACEDWKKAAELGDEDAAKLLQLALKKISTNKSVEKFFDDAKTKLESGEYQGAFDDYTKAIDIDPDNSIAYYKRGKLRKGQLNDLEGAINDLSISIKLDPKPISAYLDRAHTKDKLGDHLGAIIDNTKAIKLYPNSTIALYCRGMSKVRLNNIKGACEDFRRMIELGDEDGYELLEEYSNSNYKSANYYMKKGQEEFEEDNYYHSISFYTKGIKIEQNNPKLYFYRGQAKQMDEDLKGACEDWKKAAELGDEEAAELLKEHCE